MSPHLTCLANYLNIPFMAGLWIGSGEGWPLRDAEVIGQSSYQAGAHFQALSEPILIATSDLHCLPPLPTLTFDQRVVQLETKIDASFITFPKRGLS